MTPDASLQKLMPIRYPLTRLLMNRAHKESGHRSCDATLAHFRSKYWTAHGSKIAQSVVRRETGIPRDGTIAGSSFEASAAFYPHYA